MQILPLSGYLFRLGNVAPAGGVAGTAEIVLDAVLEDTCHVSSYFHFQTFKLKMKSGKYNIKYIVLKICFDDY